MLEIDQSDLPKPLVNTPHHDVAANNLGHLQIDQMRRV